MDQKKRNNQIGNDTTAIMSVMTNSKDGFTEEKAF